MLINMWSTGELKREIKVHDSKVYMKITRPLEPSAEPACIMLNNAHLYFPQTPDEFFENLQLYSILAVHKLRLPDEMGTIRRFLDFVQDGFDELLSASPEEKDREKQEFGEIDVTHGDTRFTKVLSR